LEYWLEFWWVFPIALAICVSVCVVAISGSVLFVPLFTLGFPALGIPMAPAQAVQVGLFTEIFGFASSTSAFLRHRLVDVRLAGFALAFAVPAAVVGGLLANVLPSTSGARGCPRTRWRKPCGCDGERLTATLTRTVSATMGPFPTRVALDLSYETHEEARSRCLRSSSSSPRYCARSHLVVADGLTGLRPSPTSGVVHRVGVGRRLRSRVNTESWLSVMSRV
jgi:hypothetical protein